MTAVQSLMLALLLVSPLSAQTINFNKVIIEALPATPVQATIVPALPKPTRVFDKKFFAVIGALGAAESARFTTRKLVL